MDGSVFLTSQDGYIYALDASTGKKQWHFSTDSSTATSTDPRRKCTPAVVDGIVYAEGSGGFLYALDTTTGEQKWPLKHNSGNIHTDPVIVGDSIYLGRGTVYTLDRRTGSLKWSRRIAGTSVVAGDDLVFVTSMNRERLYALDPRTGETRWTFDGPTGHPSYKDGTVYAGAGLAADNAEPAPCAVDASDGSQRRSRGLPSGDSISAVHAPAIANGRVFLGIKQSGALHAFSTEDGSEQWRYKTLGWVVSPVTIVDGHVYLGGRSRKIHCVRARDGKRQWTKVSSLTTNTPTVVDNVVFVGTRNGDVWALAGT